MQKMSSYAGKPEEVFSKMKREDVELLIELIVRTFKQSYPKIERKILRDFVCANFPVCVEFFFRLHFAGVPKVTKVAERIKKLRRQKSARS